MSRTPIRDQKSKDFSSINCFVKLQILLNIAYCVLTFFKAFLFLLFYLSFTMYLKIAEYVLLFVLLALLMLSIYNTLLPVPFIPTLKKTARQMIAAANLQPHDVVYDLGSGDGRLVLMAAQKGVKSAIGFEINPVLNVLARLKARVLRLHNTLFITRTIFKADFSQCTKVFIYMSSKVMSELEEKMLAELKDGTVIVSHDFKFKNLKPVQVIDEKIYVYTVVAQV